MVELYADGVSQQFEDGGWKVVRKVNIPRKTRVVAVKGIDVANVSKSVFIYFAYNCILKYSTTNDVQFALDITHVSV